jgi:O-antigen/teichoic acid export membrane protein
LCRLLAGSGSEVRGHFDAFLRLLGWIGLSTAVVLLLQPEAVISLLFTSAYNNAVPVLVSLAPAAALLPVGQFAMWTLVAHGSKDCAFQGAALQLLCVLPFIGLALAAPQVPLWVLGFGHTIGAASGLAVWVSGLRSARYDWRPGRIALATVAALSTASAMKLVESGTGWSPFAVLMATGLAVAVIAGATLWSDQLGRFSPR